MNIFEKISDRFSKVTPLPEGTHHLQAAEDEKPYRLHLRLHKDGSGLLILNASTVLQLNPTAAEYAYHFIKGTAPEEAAEQVSKRYRVDKKTALADFANFTDQIHTLISTPDLDPASFLDFERVAPHSADSTLRLDCALTYRLPSTLRQILPRSKELTENSPPKNGRSSWTKPGRQASRTSSSQAAKPPCAKTSRSSSRTPKRMDKSAAY